MYVLNVSICRKSLRFWNAAFFDAVHGEREVPAIPRFVNFQTLIELDVFNVSQEERIVTCFLL